MNVTASLSRANTDSDEKFGFLLSDSRGVLNGKMVRFYFTSFRHGPC